VRSSGGADHERLLHVAGLAEGGFDRSGVTDLRVHDDHVATAADQVQQALLVEESEIVGAQPAVDECLRGQFRFAPVAAHHRRAAQEDLAGFAVGERVSVGVARLDLDAGMHPADARESVLAPVAHAVRGEQGDHARLALPVQVVHDRADPVDRLGEAVRRQR
jgi:hypothetical protein